ncbi:RICIN domain-containing protein [Spirochaeta cellobiosiphila]|uniref:RICIN domain-containing protein n=1 Tax=Spirochaeta cellobiosiphila TaxID=504483 RepID=UPI000406ED07|nr:RICIN domain-containing protein [Spirochaeta cellobiosiphila]
MSIVRFYSVILVSFLILACDGNYLFNNEMQVDQSRSETSGSKSRIINGLQWADEEGAPIHAHGGGFIKVDNYYYWFGENRNSDYSFKEVSCYRSTDLMNWEYRGAALNSGGEEELTGTNIERPKVIYNASTDTFVMWMHWENGEHYGEARTAVASASNVEGPYTYHGSFRPYDDTDVMDNGKPGYMSRDCNLFVDDDGTGYFISSSNENMDLHLYKLTDDYLEIDYLVTKLFEGQQREAPVLFKREGTYFLLTSGCTGWSPNRAKYAVSTSLSSGWSSMKNIGDSTTYHSQPTYVIPVAGTEGTEYIYAGDRWAGAWSGPYLTSSYVWLPLEFPTSTTMSLEWCNNLVINTSAGKVEGDYNPLAFTNVNSSKVMEVFNASTSDSGIITQYDNNDLGNQHWELVYDNGGYFYLENVNSRKVMDVPSSSTMEGKGLIQYSSNGGNNQKWQLKDQGDGTYGLINKNSSLYVTVPDYSIENGTQLIQSSFNGSTNQLWTISTY